MSEFKRQHWAAAVDQVFNVIRRNIIYLLVLFFVGNSQSESNLFWYVLLAGLLFSLLSGVFSWLLFGYRVDGSELHIRKGVLVRKDLYLSKDRIQVIDITEGIIQRIFGLVKVEIKTAGSGTSGATIHAISREEAESLRNELRSEPSPEQNGMEALAEDEARNADSSNEVVDEWRISRKDLVMAAFTSGNFGLIASILGATAGQLDVFINEENVNYLVNQLPGLNNVTLIITLVVAIFFISWVFSFIGVIIKYGDFKIVKTEKELLVRSGIIERKHSTIPFNRIQAVRFVEGLLRQPLGYGMLYVESAGFEVNQKERSIVLVPYISKHDLEEFFERFVSDYEVPELEVRPPKRAFSRYLRRPNYLLVVGVFALFWFWEFWWVPALAILPLSYIGYLQFRDAGLAADSRMLSLRYRNLARTTAYILRKRVQIINEQVNPFQARMNLATLQVMAASGAKGIEFSINDLEKEDVAGLRTWLTSGKTPKGGNDILRRAESSDLPAIKALLHSNELPVKDIESSAMDFFVLEKDGALAGCIALEYAGKYGLLRSLAVADRFRGNGIGARLVERVVREAGLKDLEGLYLLTETAPDYFLRFGFQKADRSETPESIQQTQEFSSLCPESAVFMSHKI